MRSFKGRQPACGSLRSGNLLLSFRVSREPLCAGLGAGRLGHGTHLRDSRPGHRLWSVCSQDSSWNQALCVCIQHPACPRPGGWDGWGCVGSAAACGPSART